MYCQDWCIMTLFEINSPCCYIFCYNNKIKARLLRTISGWASVQAYMDLKTPHISNCCRWISNHWRLSMMTSSNGNISRVTIPLLGELTGDCGEFTSQRPVTRSFDVFFDLRLNKHLSKQSWGWWLRHHGAHYDVIIMVLKGCNVTPKH